MKLRVKILIVLVLVILLGTIIAFIPHAGSKRAVERYKRELRAKGEKLTYQELIQATPPETPDAAKPFLGANGAIVSISNSTAPMRFISPGRALVAYRQETLSADGGTNVWPKFIAEVETNRNAILSLREILQVPTLYFKLDYSKGSGTLLPHLAPLKAAEQLASASTIAALHQQNFSEAWTNLITTVALVRRYKTEPLKISHLVKLAMARMAVATTWEALQCKQWNDGQLAELQANWQDMDLFGPLEQAFAMERAIQMDDFVLARRSYYDPAGMFGKNATLQHDSFDLDQLLHGAQRYSHYCAWKWLWSYQEELYDMKTVQATIESCRATKFSNAFVPALMDYATKMTNVNQQFDQSSDHFEDPQGEQSIRDCMIKFADAENGRRIALTAIALKRYQLCNGKYPSELKDLVPTFLEKVPIDFMDGKPLRYQLQADGSFLLYSVGDDGEDNGGDATPTEPASTVNKNWLKGRDMVWPQPATLEDIEAYRTNSSPKVQKK
ncbi:hypothetical protein [Pedosphaera parvula]|uniref:Uncharacterized protein n=1 Tax=Pedosphaera parvula (strain Ellin514) TaxID=320771 RepID=B9XDL3_PEDPL|nr:hypothetical protein [Pedosphaera parvula]EEF62159.1 hypothetical protein Cflav_PD6434 [Pedosphaera parvula Ellin514]